MGSEEMTKVMQYIKLDRIFMNHVGMCNDAYQERDSFLNNEIKTNFQKVLDIVKPIKNYRPCTDKQRIMYKLDSNKDVCNTLDYEKCYTTLLDQVKTSSTDDKISFLLPYIPYLRGMLNNSAVDDNLVFRKLRRNQTIAYLLVYRYEHKISILDDLHLELTQFKIDTYNDILTKEIYDKMIKKELDLKINHPDIYQKLLEEKLKELDEIVDSVTENLKPHPIS
ncbi:hypothetical protein [Succinimonas sp.]|uniref:hypothetical protein n=1 Tax=Succinimonas sp. TaxID=1936151 RepID=UPI0038686EF2